jgi:transposase InsO family protein
MDLSPADRAAEIAQVVADRDLAAAIRTSHEGSRGRYGSPRVHVELRARGRPVSRKRVAPPRRGMGLSARRKRRVRWTTDSAHAYPVGPNLLAHDFTAVTPDRVWLSNLTYLWIAEGWLSLAVLLDLFQRRASAGSWPTTSAMSSPWPPSTCPSRTSTRHLAWFAVRIAGCNLPPMPIARGYASTACSAR